MLSALPRFHLRAEPVREVLDAWELVAAGDFSALASAGMNSGVCNCMPRKDKDREAVSDAGGRMVKTFKHDSSAAKEVKLMRLSLVASASRRVVTTVMEQAPAVSNLPATPSSTSAVMTSAAPNHSGALVLGLKMCAARSRARVHCRSACSTHMATSLMVNAAGVLTGDVAADD
jgi:hypothetical protein